eukprot:s5067_g10.t1
MQANTSNELLDATGSTRHLQVPKPLRTTCVVATISSVLSFAEATVCDDLLHLETPLRRGHRRAAEPIALSDGATGFSVLFVKHVLKLQVEVPKGLDVSPAHLRLRRRVAEFVHKF